MTMIIMEKDKETNKEINQSEQSHPSQKSAVQTMVGFKNTEVGLIPEDWYLLSYGEIFDFLNTATYSRAQLTENEEIGYVHYGDIHVKCVHFIDLDKIKLPTINRDLLKNYPTLKDGDLIVVDASEDYEGVGKSVEVRNLKNRKAISGLHTFLLRDKEEKIANGFKGYIHSNKLVKKQMDTLATGLKVYGVSKNNLKKILIPLPPKPEQEAIAKVLSDTDTLIEKLEQLIAKKRNIKTGAMQELLKPKEGWEVKKLGEVANFFSGGTPSTSNSAYYGGNIPWITSSDLNKEKIFEVDGKITEEGLMNSSAKMVRKGTLLLALYGATAGVTAITFIDAAINQAVLAIEPNSDSSEFLFYKLTSLKTWIVSTFTQGGQANLSGNIIKALELEFPNMEEQTRIAQILSDMDSEIEALERQLAKYKLLKQGMMQVLLTGKIRLNH